MLTSPLRYPGGKHLLVNYIACVLECHLLTGSTFYEPYAGGASVALELLDKGYISKAVLIERDPLIFAFWHSVLNYSEELCKKINKLDVSMATWRQLQPYRKVQELPNNNCEIVDLGLAGLFYNRTNFSGILAAGPIGGYEQKSDYKIGCRFNKERLIKQITEIAKYSRLIEVHFNDAITYLQKHSRKITKGFSFVYIDPPYYIQGKRLYRHYYEHDDHRNLSDFITKQDYPWLISYDKHSEIRDLYKDNAIQAIYLDYRVRTSRRAQELLISNVEIPPPFYKNDELENMITTPITKQGVKLYA